MHFRSPGPVKNPEEFCYCLNLAIFIPIVQRPVISVAQCPTWLSRGLGTR